MAQATVLIGDKTVVCTIQPDRYTVHPNSPHREAYDILDERVPENVVIHCDKNKAVTCWPKRPIVKSDAPCTVRYVDILYRDDKIYIEPTTEGIAVSWPANWIHIHCHSEQNAEYVITLLTASKIEEIRKSAQVSFV